MICHVASILFNMIDSRLHLHCERFAFINSAYTQKGAYATSHAKMIIYKNKLDRRVCAPVSRGKGNWWHKQWGGMLKQTEEFKCLYQMFFIDPHIKLPLLYDISGWEMTLIIVIILESAKSDHCTHKDYCATHAQRCMDRQCQWMNTICALWAPPPPRFLCHKYAFSLSLCHCGNGLP